MKTLRIATTVSALLGLLGCEETKLYSVKDSAYASPNPSNITGEGDGSFQASDNAGGSTSAKVTQGAPTPTASDTPPGRDKLEPGEVPAGGQAAGSNSAGSSSQPTSGGQPTPAQQEQQAPPSE